MKNIIKNLAFVFVLVGIFSFGAKASLAATAPSISSATASNITQTSADLSGTVNPNGSDTLVSFYTPSSGALPASGIDIGNGNSNVPLIPPYTLSGLTPGITYTFKVVASSLDGTTDSGFIYSFITLPAPTPIVVSATASNITQTSVDLSGTVNPNGSSTLVSFYTPSSGPFPVSGTDIGNGNSPIPLVPPYTLTGLTAGTTYTFKVVASSLNGTTDSGFIYSFTTLPASILLAPTITSATASNITQTSADLNGLVNPNGSSTLVSFYTSSNIFPTPLLGINIGSGNSDVPLIPPYTLSGLTPGTTYTFKVVASSLNGTTDSGFIYSFTTTSASGGGGGSGGSGGGGGGGSGIVNLASVITQNGTSLTNTGATLNGSINPNGYATTAWFEYGTTSALTISTSTTHTNEGTGSTASTLTQNITGLTPNTTYYFRVVANSANGTVKGNVVSFQTTLSTNPTNPTIPVTPVTPTTNNSGSNSSNGITTTIQATQKTSIFAKLNGLFINQNTAGTMGYFQYGKTSALGTTTTQKVLGTNSLTSFSEIITGLTPNTIYYFRAVVLNQGVTINGNVLVFQTPAAVTPVNPIVVTTPTNNEGISIVKASDVPAPQTDSAADVVVKLEITNSKDKLAVGDEANYTVTFKNIGSKNLENIKVTVQLPKEIDFKGSDLGTLQNDNTVTFNTTTLAPDQTDTFVVKGTVNSNASLQNILVTTAVASYNVAGSSLQKDAVSYITNSVTTGNGLEANTIFGIKSVPHLLGWIAFLLAILALIIIGKRKYQEDKV